MTVRSSLVGVLCISVERIEDFCDPIGVQYFQCVI